MKVIVATDFPQASPAIEAMKTRPWPENTEVCVLHVVDLPPFEQGAELLEIARRGAECVVQSMAQDLEGSGFKTRTDVVVGHPPTAIAESAKKWGADLIVVGSHGSHGIARLFLGSVAQAVVRGAPCSVEVARPAATNQGAQWKILLATDGSECAKVAARSIAERPWPARTVVRILSAVAPFQPAVSAGMAYFEETQAMELAQMVESEMQTRAREIIDDAEAILRQARALGIERSEPISGDPKRVIVEEASKWEAKMIVVGSHGRRGFDRLMMGSVSEFVTTHAQCSVEVIR